MKKSLLYIGGSFAQLAGVRCAQEAGLSVTVTDRSPDAPAKAMADEFYCVAADDIHGLLNIARALHANNTFAGAYGFSDVAYFAIGKMYEELDIKFATPSVFLNMSDKSRTKENLELAGIPVPRGRALSKFEATCGHLTDKKLGMTFPLVVKPAEVDSSQAVTTVDNDISLQRAVEIAVSLDSKVIVEEFICGDHLNIDIVLIDGRGYPVAITERHFRDHNHHQPLFGIQSATINDPQSQMLFNLVEKACLALDYRFGPATADLILTDNGPKILELSPHLHSVNLSKMISRDGVLGGWFAYAAGYENWRDRLAQAQNNNFAAYYYAYSDSPGRVVGIDGIDAVMSNEFVRDVDLRVKIGDKISASGEYKKTCAVITLESEDRLSLLNSVNFIRDNLRWETKRFN